MSKKSIGIIVAVLIVVGCLGVLGYMIYSNFQEKYARSENVMPLQDYYGTAADRAMVIIDSEVYEKEAYFADGTAYLDSETVAKMYSHRYFYDADDDMVLYTTANEVYRFTPGKCGYIVNNKEKDTDFPYITLVDGQVYISLQCLLMNGITASLYTEPNRVLITYNSEDYLAATVEKETAIRVSQDIKADVLEKMVPGDVLRFIDGGGIQQNGFIKVMSADGVRGYVEAADISDSYYVTPSFYEWSETPYTHILYDEDIYLAWHLLYTSDSKWRLEEALPGKEPINVIAPTWFFLSGTEGEMACWASQEYVDFAHEKGLKVWATYKNDTTEEFTCTEDSYEVLSSYNSRSTLINNIMESVSEYQLDGVNIDFELLSVDTGVYFVEFLRELSVACRREGVVLSVDNYVPANYNAYYDLAEQARILDYIVIMGYDEHYAGLGEAGSVSSLSWFKNAIEGTLKKADSAQVIMALPFYTRLWKEKVEDGQTKVWVEETPDMATAEKRVKNAGASKTWKEDAGQYYAEWKSDGAKFRIWLEEEDSIAAKTDAIREANLAGVAAWKLTDEKAGIWQVIEEHMNYVEPEPEETEGEAETEGETEGGTSEN